MNKPINKMLVIGLAVAFITFMAWLWINPEEHEWSGVDETVVEKFAKEAGRSPSAPLMNTDQGDLLLFVFLLAGAAGGFVGGYYFREMFSSEDKVTN